MTRGDERGFTLVELLVALLIIAALVAVALGQYSSVRARAQDREATVMLRTAHVALTLRHQREQDYRATPAALQALEPALRSARDLRVTGGDRTFEVSVVSKAGARGGGTFTLALRPDGALARTCENRGRGACRSEGAW